MKELLSCLWDNYLSLYSESDLLIPATLKLNIVKLYERLALQSQEMSPWLRAELIGIFQMIELAGKMQPLDPKKKKVELLDVRI